MTAKVIILNGVSSAGKSSLAKAIQKQAVPTFLRVEMDTFASFLPDGHEIKPGWFDISKVDTDQGELPKISTGPLGNLLLAAMRMFVINAANSGLNVIVDDVCHASEIAEYRDGLQSCQAHFIKVGAPIKIIEKREKARGDRLIGLAREQSMHLHDGIDYDLEIDTSSASAEELAALILSELYR